MTSRPDTKTPLTTGEWITVRTPTGAQITLYAKDQTYRVTAIDCYTRRLREPAEFTNEQDARNQARVWTLEILNNNMTFAVDALHHGARLRYTVDLEAKP